jgi:hypothetical protein
VTATASSTRWPRIAGIAAFVLALFLYRSYENRPVLGLWSHAYALVLAFGVVLLALCVAQGIRSWRRAQRVPKLVRLLDIATLCWGGAYLFSAIENRDAAARVLNLNAFGSVAPLPAIAEWCAMALTAAILIGWLAGRLGETGRNLLLSATALVLVALAGEGALRLRAAVAPQTQGFPTYTSQQWRRRFVALNTEGFRDTEHPKSVPEGERRLLVVGDSFAFGSGVEDIDDRLGEQLARMLTQRLREPWHSVSAALGDSDTLDEIGFLEQMNPYERDAVLLLYVFNDVDYLAPVAARTVLTEHQSGIVGRLHPMRLLFLNSYLFQEVFVRGRMATYQMSDELSPSEKGYANEALVDRHFDDLERFVELASSEGVPVWIAPFDVKASDGGRFAARYEHFRERALARGLPVLNLGRTFDGYDRALLRVNRLDGHPNALANRLAAEDLVVPIASALASGATGG